MRVYRDDGITEAHLQGQHEWLPVRTWQADEDRSWSVTVGPAEGRCDTLPATCGYELHFVGSSVPDRVLLDGQSVAWIYDPDRLTTQVGVSEVSRERAFTVTLGSPNKITALGAERNRQQIEADVARLLGDHCPAVVDLDSVLASGASEPVLLDAIARLGGPFFHAVPFVTREEVGKRLGQVVVGAPAGGIPVDVLVSFTLNREGHEEVVTVTRHGVTEGVVIDVPFAFDGVVACFQWRADVTLAWQGRTLTGSFTSAPYFPGIYRWHGVFDEGESRAVTAADYIDAIGTSASYFDDITQNPAMDRDLTELFLLRLPEHYRERLINGESLPTHLLARVVSPGPRDAVLELLSGDGVEVTLNGAPVEFGDPVSDPQIPAHFRPPRRSTVFTLLAGENSLMVRLPAVGGGRSLSAEIFSPDGRPFQDLSYR
jgi:hypothetical protein